ncbi:PLP-dependent transferase [Exidia glandulosa HHB12029]|uniref:PLP-dependent transferase n=1 Tax=Exidia glandulosa HHB12029 TaxID=1314781 RepID=A0A165L8Z6_EXIGL|nr:PLP-dependent transferase [Exidia glandulosa HHB12029]
MFSVEGTSHSTVKTSTRTSLRDIARHAIQGLRIRRHSNAQLRSPPETPKSPKSATIIVEPSSRLDPKGTLHSPSSEKRNSNHDVDVGYDNAFAAFKQRYPEYAQTSPLDDLRAAEYARLNAGETYLDWMGSAVFPQSLVEQHAATLLDPRNVFGNAHSRSASSQLSASHAEDARRAVLQFFDADPVEYIVVFTQNASAALKLVGEAYPFTPQTSLVLGVDSHNSVHGLRVFAEKGGADVRYFGCGERGGVDNESLRECLTSKSSPEHSLLVLTGLSNVTGAKARLSDILPSAREGGFDVLLDAAALAPTSRISLRSTPVDAMAISFYKMFGYPTGVGALVARREFLRGLRRPWFAGGTVDVVQVPGSGALSYTYLPHGELAGQSDRDVERWEDGTVNFLSLGAVSRGLALLTQYQDILPLRLSILSHYLVTELLRLRHSSGSSMVHIVSTLPTPLTAPRAKASSGAVIAFILLSSRGEPVRNDMAEQAAQGQVALRAGCHCNPGAVISLLHRSGFFAGVDGSDPMRWMENIHLRPESASKNAVANSLFAGDSAFGVLRFSLGLATNFRDVWNAIHWVKQLPVA